MDRPKICVVGSSNTDLVSYVPHLPKPGETLHGTQFNRVFGGKGANQAVMAAKLGADVSMVTKLGDDIFGRDTLENFKSLGIHTKGIVSLCDIQHTPRIARNLKACDFFDICNCLLREDPQWICEDICGSDYWRKLFKFQGW